MKDSAHVPVSKSKLTSDTETLKLTALIMNTSRTDFLHRKKYSKSQGTRKSTSRQSWTTTNQSRIPASSKNFRSSGQSSNPALSSTEWESDELSTCSSSSEEWHSSGQSPARSSLSSDWGCFAKSEKFTVPCRS